MKTDINSKPVDLAYLLKRRRSTLEQWVAEEEIATPSDFDRVKDRLEKEGYSLKNIIFIELRNKLDKAQKELTIEASIPKTLPVEEAVFLEEVEIVEEKPAKKQKSAK